GSVGRPTWRRLRPPCPYPTAAKLGAAPFSGAARVMRCGRTRRSCSTPCCRGLPSSLPSPRRPTWGSYSPIRSPASAPSSHPAATARLEIGLGGGEHMIAQAEQHPRTGFIGVEPFVNGMAKALAAIDLKNLSNIRLHFDDAVFLLEWLPPASLACVDLIYPDP